LLDRTHTPRGAKKAISLERVFDKDLWIPSKNQPDLLVCDAVTQDIKRGKWVARMNKKKKRVAASK